MTKKDSRHQKRVLAATEAASAYGRVAAAALTSLNSLSAKTVQMPGATRRVKEASIQATKILKDGTRVPLGTIAYTNRNPLKVLAWKLNRIFSFKVVTRHIRINDDGTQTLIGETSHREPFTVVIGKAFSFWKKKIGAWL